VARELWDHATGYSREGHRLVVYRCKRCCGFHIGSKKIVPNSECCDAFALTTQPEPIWSAS
jgi:hypothetical protein